MSRALAAPGTPFVIGGDAHGVTSLRFRGDRFNTDYVRAGAVLGRVLARYRLGGAAWHQLDTVTGAFEWRPEGVAATVSDPALTLASHLELVGERLEWRIEVTNRGSDTVEVGDLVLPLAMHTRFAVGQPATEAVLKHSFVSGHGSHLFWMRSNSAGPYLMLLPAADTHLEYWDRRVLAGDGEEDTYCAFIHGAAAAAETRATGTNWRQPTTALTLRPGERRSYRFHFRWVADYDAPRSAITDTGAGRRVRTIAGALDAGARLG